MKLKWSKRRSAWSAVGGAVLTAGLVLANPVLAQEALATSESGQVVHLHASAVREVPQDWLTMQLAVTREGADPGQVQAQIRAALDASLEAARAKVKPQSMEVRTGQFALHPRYGNNGRITGWQGQAELVLEGRDFGLISRTAASLAPLVVSGSSFSLSRQARQQLESDVQREAITQFRGKADEIAKAFGFAGYSLRQVSVSSVDGGHGQPRPVMMMARAEKAMEADAAVPVEAGKATVQVTVSGSINLR